MLSAAVATAPADYQLSASMVYIGSTSVKSSGHAVAAMTITNTGNVRANEVVTALINLVPVGGPISGNHPFEPKMKVNLLPGQHHTYRVTLNLAAALAPVSYPVNATLPTQYSATISVYGLETGRSATQVVSQTLTVNPIFPYVVGTFSGSANILSGPYKGEITSLTFDITSETTPNQFVHFDQLIGDGSNTFSAGYFPFSMIGVLTPSGRFSANATDLNDPNYFKVIGTVVGSTIRGTYVDKYDGTRATFTVSATG